MPEMIPAQMDDNNAVHGREQENLCEAWKIGMVNVFCRPFSEFQ